MNKRLLAGLAAAGIIGGGVYGFAAAITTVDSDTVGAGTDTVATCDSSVTVDYTVAWGGTEYEVATVKVGGIDTTACNGDDIAVTLMEGSTAYNATADTVDAATETFTVSGLHVSAHDLTDVHVVIAS